MLTGGFDFARYDVEDTILRLVDVDDEDRWVEALVTPAGRRALYRYSSSMTLEEAATWLKTAA